MADVMLPQTCTHKGCIRDVDAVGELCDAHSKCPECGRSKFLKFSQEPYECMACGARWEDWPHQHDWHRNGETQVVCLGCGAREERPAPDLPTIGSRWQYRNSDRIGDVCEVVEKVGNTVAKPGEVLLRYSHAAAFHVSLEQLRDQYVRVEPCVEGLPAIRIDVPRDAVIVGANAPDTRAAGNALVDKAVASPPPGVNQRAWRAALMALEEQAHLHGWTLNQEDMDFARALVKTYERERGR